MDAINQILSMGGYGGYVWPSYLVSAILLAVMLVVSLRLLKANENTMKDLETSKEETSGEEKT